MHIKVTDRLCMLAASPFDFMPSAAPLAMLPLPSKVIPGIPRKFPLHQPKLDSFLGSAHLPFHTPAGISGERLVILARWPGKMWVHQGCTSCGDCPFEVREGQLFSWYIPFIFPVVTGKHLFLAVGFPSWNLQWCMASLCIYPPCRAPDSGFIL